MRSALLAAADQYLAGCRPLRPAVAVVALALTAALGGEAGRDRSRSPLNVRNDGRRGRGSGGKSSWESRRGVGFARCPPEPAPDLEAMARALYQGYDARGGGGSEC